MPCTCNTMDMEEPSFSFKHLNRWVCLYTQRQLPRSKKYVRGCVAKAKTHLFLLNCYQSGWMGKKSQWIQQQKFQSWNNIVRVNTSLCLHCSTLQHMIQSLFLAWKAILLNVCSLVAFQTNDLTRTSQDKCWVNKGQSAARFSAFPQQGGSNFIQAIIFQA